MQKMLEVIASIQLEDFFSFVIGEPSQDLGTGREFDGWRFPVEAKIGGREYKRFHIDMTMGDSILTPLDQVPIGETLAFAGLSGGNVDAIRLAQHHSEKLHAYVRIRSRENSRVKDLFDMVFFIQQGLESTLVAEVIEKVFANCGGLKVPAELDLPPRSWKIPFEDMAANNSLKISFSEAYNIIAKFYIKVIGNLDLQRP